MSEERGSDRQRIDKWLVYARVVKTRTLGQALAASGHVRLNGRKIDDPAQPVKAGDVLTIGLHGRNGGDGARPAAHVQKKFRLLFFQGKGLFFDLVLSPGSLYRSVYQRPQA